MGVFWEGTILGLSLAFLFGFGPAFFALIQTGIHRGFLPGLFLASGIFLNDLIIVVAAVVGSRVLFGAQEHFQTMGVVGGALLVIFGLVSYFRKIKAPESEEEAADINTPHPLIYVAKGFLLNAANPFVWLFWLSMVVGITARFEGNTPDLFIFFAGTLSVVWSTDIIKTFAASRFKKVVTHRFLVIINKVAGVALTGFGIFLIIRSLLQL